MSFLSNNAVAGSTATNQLADEQVRRHEVLSSNVSEALRPFLAAPDVIFHSTPSSDDAAKKSTADSSANTPVATADVTLVMSPYDGRRSTILFEAYDKPWDGDRHTKDTDAYVKPKPLPSGDAMGNTIEGSMLLDSSMSRGLGATLTSMLARKAVERSGPFARIAYVMDSEAVPFTALLATMERAGFTRMTDRQALLDKSWALKWSKHPLMSDFVKIRPAYFQKINHFPGTWRLGRKDTLHRQLHAAVQRWDAFYRAEASSEPLMTSGSMFLARDANRRSQSRSQTPAHPQFGEHIYPRGWVLPEEASACTTELRKPENKDQLFIVKPASSAGGRGMVIIKGSANAQVPPPLPTSSSTSAVSSPTMRKPPSKDAARRQVVQRYVANPVLVHGYKFDLRLYVVITSYEPMRMYIYKEGLVRFATTPYYTEKESDVPWDDSERVITPEDQLTAHLTNFTINKKSEEFAAPVGSSSKQQELLVSKWCLAALREHMIKEGLDWDLVWSRIKDLLAKTFMSVLPEVRREMRDVHQAQCEKQFMPSSADATPPCTSRGVSPFFEIYGVDVLLQEQPSENAHDGGKKDIKPTLMEVNIMPSLSTHYSPLDQCIKGNFIADALTLVGLTTPLLKPSVKPTACPGRPSSSLEDSVTTTSAVGFSYGDDFLDQIQDPIAVEACLTAAEELKRGTNFDRVLPTATSFSDYEPLFKAVAAEAASPSSAKRDGDDDGVSFLDELLDDKKPAKNTAAAAAASSTETWLLDQLLCEWESSKVSGM